VFLFKKSEETENVDTNSGNIVRMEEKVRQEIKHINTLTALDKIIDLTGDDDDDDEDDKIEENKKKEEEWEENENYGEKSIIIGDVKIEKNLGGNC
jgi:hypothetical protein